MNGLWGHVDNVDYATGPRDAPCTSSIDETVSDQVLAFIKQNH
jgi:hypothetical protein